MADKIDIKPEILEQILEFKKQHSKFYDSLFKQNKMNLKELADLFEKINKQQSEIYKNYNENQNKILKHIRQYERKINSDIDDLIESEDTKDVKTLLELKYNQKISSIFVEQARLKKEFDDEKNRRAVEAAQSALDMIDNDKKIKNLKKQILRLEAEKSGGIAKIAYTTKDVVGGFAKKVFIDEAPEWMKSIGSGVKGLVGRIFNKERDKAALDLEIAKKQQEINELINADIISSAKEVSEYDANNNAVEKELLNRRLELLREERDILIRNKEFFTQIEPPTIVTKKENISTPKDVTDFITSAKDISLKKETEKKETEEINIPSFGPKIISRLDNIAFSLKEIKSRNNIAKDIKSGIKEVNWAEKSFKFQKEDLNIQKEQLKEAKKDKGLLPLLGGLFALLGAMGLGAFLATGKGEFLFTTVKGFVKGVLSTVKMFQMLFSPIKTLKAVAEVPAKLGNVFKTAAGHIKNVFGALKTFFGTIKRIFDVFKTLGIKAGAGVVKDMSKMAMSGTGKVAFKKIPLIGALMGLIFGIMRMTKGDILGGVLEFASGATSLIPGAGFPLGLAIDAVIFARDIAKLKKGGKGKEEKKEPAQIPTPAPTATPNTKEEVPEFANIKQYAQATIPAATMPEPLKQEFNAEIIENSNKKTFDRMVKYLSKDFADVLSKIFYESQLKALNSSDLALKSSFQNSTPVVSARKS